MHLLSLLGSTNIIIASAITYQIKLQVEIAACFLAFVFSPSPGSLFLARGEGSARAGTSRDPPEHTARGCLPQPRQVCGTRSSLGHLQVGPQRARQGGNTRQTQLPSMDFGDSSLLLFSSFPPPSHGDNWKRRKEL